MKAKTFFTYFLIFLVLFTALLIPLLNYISSITIFKTGDIGRISQEMDVFLDSDSEFFDAFSNSKRMNILVVGVNEDLTDTIMLASWDMNRDKVDVISVPRDTYYKRTGHTHPTEWKINSAYSSDGIKGTANAVSDVLEGIPINYYMVVNYDAVKTIVDAIGGVPMDVPMDMYYEDPWADPPLLIDLKQGYQVLDGDHAVQFLRFRKGYKNGDLGRVEAQQEFIRSAFQQCVKNGILNSARVITKNVQSDLTVGAASRFALSALGMKEDAITTYQIPGSPKMIEELSFFIQNKEGTRELLTQIYQIDEEDGSADVEPAENAENMEADTAAEQTD